LNYTRFGLEAAFYALRPPGSILGQRPVLAAVEEQRRQRRRGGELLDAADEYRVVAAGVPDVVDDLEAGAAAR